MLKKWDKKRAFELLILKNFSNFHSVRKAIVISEKMPVPAEIPTRDNEEVVECKDLQVEVYVL